MLTTEQHRKIMVSSTISRLRFPLIFLVIMLHGYSVVQIPGNHATYFKAMYPFALWLGETGVPGFFFISGFLFFLSHKTYFEKNKGSLSFTTCPLHIVECVVIGCICHSIRIRASTGYQRKKHSRFCMD